MAATAAQRTRLRFELGHDATSLPDADANAIWDWAVADYGSYDADVWMAAAVLIGRKNLLAQARKQVTYKAGQSSENLTDIAKGLAEDIARDEKKLEEAIQKNSPAAKIVATRKKPPVYRSNPS